MINLLIVDDESIFRTGLKTLIENEFTGVNVIEAENGLDAFEIIQENTIDGMFLDINMPRMSGLELLETLKEKAFKKIPTIIVSGFDDFEYARRAIRNEVYDYLLKPLTPNESRENVRKLLEKIKAEKSDNNENAEIISTENLSVLSDSIVKYVEAHYKEDFSIGRMADELGYNANYISQAFKNETGIKLNDYIRNYRIERAKELLKRGSHKITDIAAEVGISNTQYFSTVFKTLVGCTPQEYRENSNKN